MIRQVVLVGLSGSGKSTVGTEVAALLGWPLIDTDAEITRETGRAIPDLFRECGEPGFREIERGVVHRALARDRVVVSTGGGAVLDPGVWDTSLLGSSESLVVWLDADPDELARRLIAHAEREGAAAARPLLEGDDLPGRLSAMRRERAGAYSQADVVLPADSRSVEAIASDIAELVRLGSGQASEIELRVEGAGSTIRIGAGVRHELPEVIAAHWPRAQAVWVMVDSGLAPHVEPYLEQLKESAPVPVHVQQVPAGESSKSLAGASALYDWMLHGGVTRSDVVVALGGGVVGDLAGFVAATVLRGIGTVQIPTTLLSMVDSSVGGKTGINHSRGKNLIGAFSQPSVVLIDPEFLDSLPEREFRSGWGEIVKHAVIQPSTPGGEDGVLLSVLERNVAALLRRSLPLLPWVIRQNVSLKAAVVEADERESGIRAYLNFGHTIGHAVEASSYALLHGEAVSVGMCGALAVARELGEMEPHGAARIHALIEAFGLPTWAKSDPELVTRLMVSDKKKASGAQTWVVPRTGGGVFLSSQVPIEVVERAVLEVTRPPAIP